MFDLGKIVFSNDVCMVYVANSCITRVICLGEAYVVREQVSFVVCFVLFYFVVCLSRKTRFRIIRYGKVWYGMVYYIIASHSIV